MVLRVDGDPGVSEHDVEFQYPLVDRVGFEGTLPSPRAVRARTCFSILWWIELVLRDAVSSGAVTVALTFQYPLVDRVGFEGDQTGRTSRTTTSFSILWWIELVLRASFTWIDLPPARRFSILWWIELVLREPRPKPSPTTTARFSILWWIELVLRAARPRSPPETGQAVSVSSGGSSWF